MENLDNEINSEADHLRSNFSEIVLLSQDDLNIMNLESSDTIPVDTTPINFDQRNEQSTGISMIRESEMISSQAYITIPMINDVCYLNTDAMNDELNSSGMSIQDDPETISAGSSGNKKKTNQCRVCHRAAGKHIYYGARVCQCCRAFFRRSIRRFYNRKNFAYTCSCEERCDETKIISCQIYADSKRNCKYCRYLKCLEAGMAKKMVKLEKSNCNLKNKRKAIKFAANKDAKYHNEDVKPSKALQRSNACTTEISTPTTIIDIAQKYSETQLFLSDEKIKGIMSSQDTKDILVLTIMCLKFENALNKQVYQIAMEFQEFLQLEQSLKVRIMEENNDALINLCKIRLMLNCTKAEFSDTSETQFFQSFIAKNWSTTDIESKDIASIGSAKKRVLEKAIMILKRDQRLFYFIFPVVLFSLNEELKKESKALVDEHAEHFMKLLTRYLNFTSNDNKQYVAITCGTIVELVYNLKHWNEFDLK